MMAGIGDEYWSLALDEERWQRGFPAGITSEDIRMVFPEQGGGALVDE